MIANNVKVSYDKKSYFASLKMKYIFSDASYNLLIETCLYLTSLWVRRVVVQTVS